MFWTNLTKTDSTNGKGLSLPSAIHFKSLVSDTGSILRGLLFLTFFFIFCGCQTTALLTTDPPGASVYDGEKLLGVTPLTLDLHSLNKSSAGGHLLNLRKPGFHRILVWMPAWISGLDLSLNLVPFQIAQGETRKATQDFSSRRVLYATTASLLQLQNRVLSDAESTDKVVEEFDSKLKQSPDLGSLHFLKAVVMMRQNKEDEAKKSLERAMQLSPREYDFMTLYNIVSSGTETKK